ncbi:MAG: hypothetical protein AAF555_02235 [Verrucomicrobiota bacterium]
MENTNKRNREVCHDLKTESEAVAAPLPAALKLVPIFFYLAALAGTGLSAKFLLQLQGVRSEQQQFELGTASAQRETTKLQGIFEAVEQEAELAREVAEWISGTENLQPLVLLISRSIEDENSVSQLNLERSAENPAQINLNLALDGQESQRQLEITISRLSEIEYRPYSAERSLGYGSVDYKATLIKQN